MIMFHSNTDTIIDLIPLISELSALFFGSLGIRSLTFTVIVEMMPEKIKEAGVTFFAAFFWLLTSDFANFNFEIRAMVFISAIIYLIGAEIIYLLVPETRRKNRREIMKLF